MKKKTSISQALNKTSVSPKKDFRALREYNASGGTDGSTHSLLLPAAYDLRRLGVSASDSFDYLLSIYLKKYPNGLNQVQRVIDKVFFKPFGSGSGKRMKRTRSAQSRQVAAKPSKEQVQRAIDFVLSMDDIPLLSARKVLLKPHELLGELFSPSDLICMGHSTSDFITAKLDDYEPETIDGCQFVVPNKMTKIQGTTQEGKTSYRCKDNASTPPEFLVYECDILSETKDQIKVISFIAQYLPPVLILFSGGKSLHCWFKAPKQPHTVAWVKQLLCLLGADPQSLIECQMVRMPNGKRDNEKTQQVKYYDPQWAERASDYEELKKINAALNTI